MVHSMNMGRYEQQLENKVKDLQGELDRDKNERIRRKRRDRERVAFSKLPDVTPKMEFWCDRCRFDFVAPAYKVYSYIHDVGSWHSMCPSCESIVYRHITAKKFDPYYAKSEKVRIMQGESIREILQPGQYGFRTMYGDPFEHYYMRFQKRQEEIFNKYASIGLVGKSIAQKTEEETVREMLE